MIAIVLKTCGVDINPDVNSVSFSSFSIVYCAIFIGFAIYPILNVKDVGFLLRINSAGIYFVAMLILFAIGYSVSFICSNSYDFQYLANIPGQQPRHVYLFGTDISKLCGCLSLGFFIHTVISPMMKKNAKQENCKRDLFIGYLLTYITYLVIGVVGYFGFLDAGLDKSVKDVQALY